MLPSKHKRPLLGLYLIALIGLGWLIIQRARPQPATIDFSRPDDDAVYVRSQLRARESHSGPLVPKTPEQWHAYLTREEATLLMPVLKQGRLFLYDPWMYMVGPARQRHSRPWPEHPGGRVDSDSNSVGLRGDQELAERLPDLRVLVAGDSHSYGVCRSTETFSALLQSSLLELHPGKTAEVLNAANGGYTFYNYVGTLLRWRERAPQVLVVAVFGGNDFLEALPFLHYFAGERMEAWRETDRQLLERALAASPNAMAQGLQSAFCFQCMPRQVDLALESAIGTLAEIRAIGEELGTRLVVCFLPNPCALAFDPPLEQVSAATAILVERGFSMQTQTRLEQRFVQRLLDGGFECVDMRPCFAAEPSPPFWRKDLHLSVRGHELVAKALGAVVSRLLER